MVVYVATPAALNVPDPSVAPASMKLTEPVGTAVPEPGATVADSVTLLPMFTCAEELVSAVAVLTPAKSVVASAALLAASTLPAPSVAML